MAQNKTQRGQSSCGAGPRGVRARRGGPLETAEGRGGGLQGLGGNHSAASRPQGLQGQRGPWTAWSDPVGCAPGPPQAPAASQAWRHPPVCRLIRPAP